MICVFFHLSSLVSTSLIVLFLSPFFLVLIVTLQLLLYYLFLFSCSSQHSAIIEEFSALHKCGYLVLVFQLKGIKLGWLFRDLITMYYGSRLLFRLLANLSFIKGSSILRLIFTLFVINFCKGLSICLLFLIPRKLHRVIPLPCFLKVIHWFSCYIFS